MKLNYKKTLKIVTLIMTAAIIATVSAATYDYLNLSAGVGVEGTLTLNWDDTGIDTDITADIQGVYCTLTGMEAPAGGTRTYSNAIKLTSTGATTFDIDVAAVTGTGTTDLTSIVVRLYDESEALQGTLTVWDGDVGDTPVLDMTMSGAVTWRLEWDITWASTATVGDTVTVTLQLTTPSLP